MIRLISVRRSRAEEVELYLSTARRPDLETKRVNVDFPVWMIAALDREAQRLGVHRQAVIETWIAQRLDALAGKIS